MADNSEVIQTIKTCRKRHFLNVFQVCFSINTLSEISNSSVLPTARRKTLHSIQLFYYFIIIMVVSLIKKGNLWQAYAFWWDERFYWWTHCWGSSSFVCQPYSKETWWFCVTLFAVITHAWLTVRPQGFCFVALWMSGFKWMFAFFFIGKILILSVNNLWIKTKKIFYICYALPGISPISGYLWEFHLCIRDSLKIYGAF